MFAPKIIEILKVFRNGEEGYYGTMSSMLELWNAGLMSIADLDEALLQLRDDYAMAKQFGWNNVAWVAL